MNIKGKKHQQISLAKSIIRIIGGVIALFSKNDFIMLIGLSIFIAEVFGIIEEVVDEG